MSEPETSQETNKDVGFCGHASVQDFRQAGLKSIVEATKTVNALPSGASRDLYNAHPSFSRIMLTRGDRILNAIANVIRLQNIRGNIVRRDEEEKFELLQECNDAMLERINSNLDDMDGIKKVAPETIIVQQAFESPAAPRPVLNGSWNERQPTMNVPAAMRSAKLFTARNIARPQVNFRTPVDNSSTNPFVPMIKYKPNSLKPLAVLPEYDDEGRVVSYLHPYEFELDRFEPPAEQLKRAEVRKPRPIEETELLIVEDEVALRQLMAELEGEKEIAIDVEHHSYRTFQGITCLMQISTRRKDYIVDTLALREELHVLNEIFTRPTVVKVFHGADSDIEWLQRDLALYVVNMFDTGQAARRLNFARFSLAYLLKHYCGMEADKTFQLADWRMRPLPDELIDYARQDTHSLLYIYDRMRNELIDAANCQPNLLRAVYQASTDICKKRYVKPYIHAESYLDVYRKSKRVFDNRQLHAMLEIFAWRDKMARQEDESFGYVLPNHMMLQIAETLPREMQGILACCNPIPPLVRQHLHVLHQMVLRAREQSVIKKMPVMEERPINRETTISNYKDYNNPLYCPHDIPSGAEVQENLPTLLENSGKAQEDVDIEMSEPTLTIFQSSDEEEEMQKPFTFITPFQRYQLVLPYVEEQRKKDAERERQLQASKKLCPEKGEESAVPAEAMKEQPKEPEEELYSVPMRQWNKRQRELAPKEETESVPTTKRRKMVLPEPKFTQKEEPKEETEVVVVEDETSPRKGGSNQNKSKTWRNKRQRFGNAPKNNRQDSNRAIEIDLTKVDYSRFAGGSKAGQNQPQMVITQKFRGRGGRSNSQRKFRR